MAQFALSGCTSAPEVAGSRRAVAPLADGGADDATVSGTLDPLLPIVFCSKCETVFRQTRCGHYVLCPCNPVTLCPGPCPTPPSEIERCDGRDNDCNGVIDDPDLALCNDNVDCTVDTCLHLVRGSGPFSTISAFCTNVATDSLCGPDDGNSCTTNTCTPPPGHLTAPVSGCVNTLSSVPCVSVSTLAPIPFGTGTVNGSETAPVFVRGSTSGRLPALAYGFNSATTALGVGGTNGWGRSLDGATWPVACSGNFPGCGGGPSALVPMATGLLGTHNQVSWRGDPGMAAAPDGFFVAYTNLANTDLRPSGLPDAVVISFSGDSGATFTATEFVTDTGCGVGNFEDQPAITSDPANVNRIWVAWHHRVFGGKAGGCIRGGDFDVTTRRMAWFDLGSSFPVETEFHSSVGGMRMVAFDDTITVVYSNTERVNDCSGTRGVVWLSITSFDRGVHWTQESVIYTSTLQPTCLPSDTNQQVQPGMINFDFAQVPGAPSDYWAVFPADNAAGVVLYYSTNQGADWHFAAQVVQSGGPSFAFLPSLGVDEQGRVLVQFQSIDDTGTQVFNWVAANPRGIRSPGAWTGAAFNGPYASGRLPTLRQFGDYNGIAAFPRGTFAAAPFATFLATWTDLDAGGNRRPESATITVAP